MGQNISEILYGSQERLAIVRLEAFLKGKRIEFNLIVVKYPPYYKAYEINISILCPVHFEV